MAVRACIALLLSSLVYSSTAHALEGLNDSAMSDVVAQEGIILRSEYEVAIDSIQYFDEDDFGTISMTDVNIATRAQQVIDIEVVAGSGERANRNGIRFTNQELPIDFSVDTMRINGKSVGGFGMTNLTMGGVEPLVVNLWAGGYDLNGNNLADESGFTLDLSIPKESSYDLYYEDDGTRLSMTVDYCSARSGNICTAGGLNIKGLTFDVTDKGLRMGIPEITSGQLNIRNFKINNSVINDITLKNFTIPSGGYINLGAPDDAGKSAIQFDVYLASGTGFDFQFFDSSDDDVQEMNATIAFVALASDAGNSSTNYFYAKNNSLNVRSGDEQGILIELGDSITNTGGVRGTISANDIVIKPANSASAPVLGSVKMNLEILPGSYLEVMGH
jgi:hypothetical protein